MKNWASLGRVSTDEQFEQGDSYEYQLKLNLETILKHKGQLYKEYREEGVSAYKKRVHQRPVMVELLNDIAAGKVKNLVAYKRDRICRDPEDYYVLRNIFSKAKVKVHLTCGSETWGDPDTNSPTDELMDGLLPLLAKFESMTTAQRVRSVVHEAVKRGEWRIGRPPYGYTYDKNTKRVIQVKHQVEVVRLIRNLYVEGYGSGKIADLLNNKYKIPYESPAGWKGSLKRKPRNFWYEPVVTAVVSKPVYMGIQEWGGEWHECPAIEAIFTKQEWEEANAIYRTKFCKKVPHKYFNSVFLYKDVMFCAYCGEKLIPTYKSTKYEKQDGTISIYENYHYKCSGRWDKMNGCKCKKHNRNSLEEAINQIISERIDDFDIDSLYQKLVAQTRQEIKTYNTSLSQLQAQIKNSQKDSDKYLEAYLQAPPDSVIRKGLETKFEDLNQQLENLKKEFNALVNNPPKEDIEQSQVIKVYEGMAKWRGMMNNPDIGREVKRKMALDVVKRIEVDNEGNIDIEFRINKEFPRYDLQPLILKSS